MEKPIETGRQFVNTWECDENSHMNVQFYFLHFENADMHFWSNTGLDDSSSYPVPKTQHVRFHKELAAGDLINIHSHLAPHGRGFALCHNMTGAENGELAATSWSPLTEAALQELAHSGLPVAKASPETLPRSFGDVPAKQFSSSEVIDAGFAVCLKSVVQKNDCDADGLISTKGLIGNLSNGAPHFWNHIGLDKAWLNVNNYGRVAVEFKLTKFANLTVGTPIVVRSGLTGYTGKTICFRHYIFDLVSQRPYMAVDVTGLAIDLSARKAVSWRDDHEVLLDARLVNLPES